MAVDHRRSGSIGTRENGGDSHVKLRGLEVVLLPEGDLRLSTTADIACVHRHSATEMLHDMINKLIRGRDGHAPRFVTRTKAMRVHEIKAKLAYDIISHIGDRLAASVLPAGELAKHLLHSF